MDPRHITPLTRDSWSRIVPCHIDLTLLFHGPIRTAQFLSHSSSIHGNPTHETSGAVLYSRLDGADECAHEFAVHLRGDRFGIDALVQQERQRVLRAVDAGRFDVDLLETR